MWPGSLVELKLFIGEINYVHETFKAQLQCFCKNNPSCDTLVYTRSNTVMQTNMYRKPPTDKLGYLHNILEHPASVKNSTT